MNYYYSLTINDIPLPETSFDVCLRLLRALNPEQQFCKVRIWSVDELVCDTTDSDTATKKLVKFHQG
jgi:hypothetical protein